MGKEIRSGKPAEETASAIVELIELMLWREEIITHTDQFSG
jgi:hypothetical protein